MYLKNLNSLESLSQNSKTQIMHASRSTVKDPSTWTRLVISKAKRFQQWAVFSSTRTQRKAQQKLPHCDTMCGNCNPTSSPRLVAIFIQAQKAQPQTTSTARRFHVLQDLARYTNHHHISRGFVDSSPFLGTNTVSIQLTPSSPSSPIHALGPITDYQERLHTALPDHLNSQPGRYPAEAASVHRPD